MMPLRDVLSFCKRRAKLDTPQAFIARLLRLGLLAACMIDRERKATKLRKAKTAFVCPVQGSNMLLNPDDTGISTDLLLDGIREPLITKAFREMLKSGDIVFDCGANIGYYALQEAAMVGCRGKVFAVEPVPGNARRLQNNVDLNCYRNIRVVQVACGDSDRDDTINVSTMSNMCSMIKKDGYRRYVNQVPVKVLTVDSLMRTVGCVPDVLRMDVEGYEVEIIKGAEQLLKSGKPLTIFMEVHFDILLDKVLPMLRALHDAGFTVAVATFEPHAAVWRNRIVYPVVQWCEGVMGAKSGYLDLTMGDLLTWREFRTGQVEDLEVIFVRK